MDFVSKKLYYKIGEVCKILGVEAHVLRYWEREFACLSPPKSRTGHRTYRPRDVDLLLNIRRLLYDEGFTIEGARRKLGTSKPQRAGSRRVPRIPEAHPKPHRAKLEKVRAELESILTLLDRG